jgi:predicted nucleotidyltransferase component of viral defense system
MFRPHLDILPAPQRRLWAELNDTPTSFVLYGGTALALRLGHRQSEDFDFFQNQPFDPSTLLDSIDYLERAEVSQLADNTLTVIVDRSGPVKVSFFGGLDFNRAKDPDVVQDNRIRVASTLDVVATKLKTVQQRAQSRDYIDIAAALDAGIDLAEALAAAVAVFGQEFNGVLSLKALTYFEDGDLPSLKDQTREKLWRAATSVDFKRLPRLETKSGVNDERADHESD